MRNKPDIACKEDKRLYLITVEHITYLQCSTGPVHRYRLNAPYPRHMCEKLQRREAWPWACRQQPCPCAFEQARLLPSRLSASFSACHVYNRRNVWADLGGGAHSPLGQSLLLAEPLRPAPPPALKVHALPPSGRLARQIAALVCGRALGYLPRPGEANDGDGICGRRRPDGCLRSSA